MSKDILPTAEEFQRVALDYLRDHTIRDLAHLADASIPTVERWVKGDCSPHKYVREGLMNLIKEQTK